MKRLPILAITLVLCLGFAAQAVARTYTYTDLGSLSASWERDTRPYAINNKGQVVGKSNDQAFVWENGQMRPLIGGGGMNAVAYDINDHGQIVGVDDGRRAVIWQNAEKQLMATNIGSSGSNGPIRPININNNGLVAMSNGYNQSVFWKDNAYQQWPNSNAALTGTTPVVSGLNDSNQLAGNANGFAFSQSGTTVTLLTPDDWNTKSYAINADGVVVGAAKKSGDPGQAQAVIWNGSTPQFLGEIDRGLGFAEGSVALGINSSGVVVGKNGSRSDLFGPGPAFMYDPATGELIDLNTLELAGAVGMYLVGAIDINNNGQIIGVAKQGNNARLHGFILTPTPIPGAVWLLGTGLLGLIGLRRKNRTH